MRVRALDHLVLRVRSADRALAWYTGELGLTADREEEWRRGEAPFPSVRVDPGTVIDLVEREKTGENVDHFCLVVDGVDMEAMAASGRFDVVEGPAPRWGARGEGTALYVRDPDGNVVELRSYP
ncbi:MAG: VOC family protein [Actinomycetota bacterium]|nr:VOC family protein [Actinomycetota bacterium]